jgi:hypothetical protein
VHVLRNVHGSLREDAFALDIHPLGVDMAVQAGSKGLGFVDVSDFAAVLGRMEQGVATLVREGLLVELRILRRHVVERFDTPEELIEEADGWEHLCLPAAVRRRVAAASGRMELVDTVLYRLFRRGEP